MGGSSRVTNFEWLILRLFSNNINSTFLIISRLLIFIRIWIPNPFISVPLIAIRKQRITPFTRFPPLCGILQDTLAITEGPDGPVPALVYVFFGGPGPYDCGEPCFALGAVDIS